MIKFFIGVILFCTASWAVLITLGLFAGIANQHARSDVQQHRAASH